MDARLLTLFFLFFIVIVGISSVLALTNLRRMGLRDGQLFAIIAKRSAYIFLMGLVLNLLPNHFDLTHLRILGVLQTHCALLFFRLTVIFDHQSTNTNSHCRCPYSWLTGW